LLKASLNPEVPSSSGLRCEQCGFTPEQFKKSGRFGCPHCYETFTDILTPMLEGMHKGMAHTGKVPERALQRKVLFDRLNQLEGDLKNAIEAERYEDAAKYRDEIVQVREQAGMPEEPKA